ncbi:MAG: CtsR family transcriptional regulator [Synergistaceae bacterium]|nr:CtsR family transcriptional regulator [Synergistaceae bacterium]
MQNLSHDIEMHILELMGADDEAFIELRRKELAEAFGCVPSQINYVLRSRFSPEHGYLIESRRGGKGYIRIIRINYETPEEKIDHIEDIIGNSISIREAQRVLEMLQSKELITARERLLIEIALREVNDKGSKTFELNKEAQGKMQADMMKRLLSGLMRAGETR